MAEHFNKGNFSAAVVSKGAGKGSAVDISGPRGLSASRLSLSEIEDLIEVATKAMRYLSVRNDAKLQGPEGNDMKIQVEVEVSRECLAHALCSGMEGGIQYWARIQEYVAPPDGADIRIDGFDQDDDKTVYKHIHYPMCEAGGGVVISDVEQHVAFEPTLLDHKALQRGLQLLAREHPKAFASLTANDADADVGDALIQLSLFGEIVFG